MSDIPPPLAPVAPVAPPFPSEPEPEPELVPLDRLPTPPYVLAVAAIAIIAFVIGLTRFPGAISKAVSYEKGVNLLHEGKASVAVQLLEETHRAYPESMDVTLDLADAYFHSDMYLQSAETLEPLDGKKATDEQIAKYKALDDQLGAKLDELEKSL